MYAKISWLLMICLWCFSSICIAQGNRQDSIASILDRMAAHNVYESSYTVGYTGAYSSQYQLYEKLVQLATAAELTQLILQHKNAVVRLYAYRALKTKMAEMPEDVIAAMVKDRSKLITLNGCIAQDRSVDSIFNMTFFSFHSPGSK